MKKIIITIETENEAFEGDELGLEVERILEKIADDFGVGLFPTVIHDINGNKVGKIEKID